MHSTSVRTVKSSSYVKRAFPSVFFRQRRALLIILSKNKPLSWGFLKIKLPLDFPFQNKIYDVRDIEDLC